MKRVLVAGLVVGCAGTGRPVEALTETVRSYHDGIRWERFEVAAASLPPRERATAIDEWDTRAHDLKISDYEVVKMDPRGSAAKVQIKLSWYRQTEGTLHETQSLETWERHGKAWYLVDEKRLRGDTMPGLADPVDRAVLDGTR